MADRAHCILFTIMRLTTAEMQLLTAACADSGNDAAQELLNLFAVQAADELLMLIPTIPLGLLAEITAHLWRAVNHEHRKRTGCDLVFVDASAPLPVSERRDA